MAGAGEPAVATSDPRLIAITGERAAWHGRSSESWEHVMPWGIRTAEQQRLAAAGSTVRVAVPSGRGAVVALAGHVGGRP
jgi:proline dehydrogenase